MAEGAEKLRELTLQLVHLMAEKPGLVKVHLHQENDTVTIHVTADDADVSLLNDQRGRTIRALTNIVDACASTLGLSARVDVGPHSEAETASHP